MPPSLQYASFLIRLWRHVGGDPLEPPAGWHSEAEHIQSGERWDFETLDQLLDFLRQETEAGDTGANPRASER
jgi:hypothetical protein